MSNDYPEDAIELIKTAVLVDGDGLETYSLVASPYEDNMHRDLLFALRCVGDCASAGGEFRQRIVKKVLSYLFILITYLIVSRCESKSKKSCGYLKR